ncbi:GIY-YIG nuclease family protein [Methylobacterium sp. E-045]|uniref:GIY-YIG nuclease family protein n=1 Tax=Methylobacterium sp. E-045 TaxID=2836575 RepID=UPI001FB92F78|nr:GIY-YIG nuclease family protein [Methylobacterium sp. E-045]MCJ2128304.1 GIY-YIG nuclease family protein [Methylobacterium sp. E-045]
MPIIFNSLLEAAGLDPYNVRLLRHTTKSKSMTPYKLWQKDPLLFEEYQSLQVAMPYRVGNKLASFVIDPSGDTLFVGLYVVNGIGVSPDGTRCLCTNEEYSGVNMYDISRTDLMTEYVGRLTIDWGPGTRRWFHLANNHQKPVRELRIAFKEIAFPGYFIFRCKLSDLTTLPNNWIDRLRQAKGVYVLTSETARKHYVGSAAGAGGFYQRWLQHAAVGGAAVGLQAHQAADYQVAILQVAAGFESDDDIVRTEHHWMDKLQTRGMGLNGQPKQDASNPPQPLP